MSNYPIFKGRALLSIGKNKTSNNYVMLVKASTDSKVSYSKQETKKTMFAVEFDSSEQVDAYMQVLSKLYVKLKKEGL